MDQQMKEQLDRLVAALSKETQLVVEADEEVAQIKEELKEAKDRLKQRQAKQQAICKDIMSVQSGQRLLPFEEGGDPDHIEGTPALNAVAKLFYEKGKATDAALNTPIAHLAEYGFTEKAIEAIQEQRGVSIMGDLAKDLENADWKVKGFGAKKKEQLEEAVRNFFASPPTVSAPKTVEREEPDHRVKECLECGVQREQDEEKCGCSSTTFELVDRHEDEDQAQLEDETEEVGSIEPTDSIICESGAVVDLYVVEEGGKFYSSYAFEHEGKTIGRRNPFTGDGATAHETHGKALRAAGRGAGVEMIPLSRDDDGSNIREWVSELARIQTTPQPA